MEWTLNQVVAYNLRRIRLGKGLTQEEAADLAADYLPGGRWSRVVWSAAERSVAGKRIRQFDADEIVGLAAAFGVPVMALFLPPDPDEIADLVLKPSNAESAVKPAELLGLAAEFDRGTQIHARRLAEALAPEADPQAFARSVSRISGEEARRDAEELVNTLWIVFPGGERMQVRQIIENSGKARVQVIEESRVKG